MALLQHVILVNRGLLKRSPGPPGSAPRCPGCGHSGAEAPVFPAVTALAPLEPLEVQGCPQRPPPPPARWTGRSPQRRPRRVGRPKPCSCPPAELAARVEDGEHRSRRAGRLVLHPHGDARPLSRHRPCSPAAGARQSYRRSPPGASSMALSQSRTPGGAGPCGPVDDIHAGPLAHRLKPSKTWIWSPSKLFDLCHVRHFVDIKQKPS